MAPSQFYVLYTNSIGTPTFAGPYATHREARIAWIGLVVAGGTQLSIVRRWA